MLQALKDDTIELDFDDLLKSEETTKQRRAKFALQEQIFRGPIVIRPTPSTRKWWLRLDAGERTLRTWEIESDPLRNPKVAGVFSRERDKKRLTLEGDIPPQSPLNPSKDTPSAITVLDKGEAIILEDTQDFLRIDFKGKKFKGVYVFQRETPGQNIFLIQAAKLPEASRG